MEKLILIMDIELEKVVGGARFSTEQKKFFIAIGSLVAVAIVAIVTIVVMGCFIVKFRRAASHATLTDSEDLKSRSQVTKLTTENAQLKTEIESLKNAKASEIPLSNSAELERMSTELGAQRGRTTDAERRATDAERKFNELVERQLRQHKGEPSREETPQTLQPPQTWGTSILNWLYQ